MSQRTSAFALGVLQGPTELLPVSSSAHTTIVPWLLGRESRTDKAFEVALHAGTALALVRVPERPDLLLASLLAPAIAGCVFEGEIERRFGTPATIAAGLAAGSLVMLLADRAPERRAYDDAGVADALWLGVAQACALIPGVSRSGATLAAARLRGFTGAAAGRLSREAALPVIAGATALKAVRLRGVAAGPLIAGAGGAFLSTLLTRRRLERERPLTPFALYRLALAAATVVKLGCNPVRTGYRAPRMLRSSP